MTTIKAEEIKSRIDTCKICLLAEVMKDCKRCNFQVGLQYKKEESKMPKNKRLKELQAEKYYFIQNDSELSEVLESIGLKEECKKDITGCVLLIGDGEYIAVWLTEESRYYDLNACYHPLTYYKTHDMFKNIYLPEYWKENNTEYN